MGLKNRYFQSSIWIIFICEIWCTNTDGGSFKKLAKYSKLYYNFICFASAKAEQVTPKHLVRVRSWWEDMSRKILLCNDWLEI